MTTWIINGDARDLVQHVRADVGVLTDVRYTL